MKSVRGRWKSMLERQQQHPTGLLGRWVGEQMRRQHARESEWTIKLLDLQPADRVLELGFGAGHGLARVLQAVHQGKVTGLDISRTMARAARGRSRTAWKNGQLRLLQADFDRLPFGPALFDRIFTIHTLYFTNRPEIFLSRLAKMLVDGGRLVCTFATAQISRDGKWEPWPLQARSSALVKTLGRQADLSARLIRGPDVRSYNSMAIVVDRLPDNRTGRVPSGACQIEAGGLDRSTNR